MSWQPTDPKQALFFAVAQVEICGSLYSNGEVCLENGALHMDIPDPMAPAPTPAAAPESEEEPAPGKSKPAKKKKKKGSEPPVDPGPLKTVSIPVRDIHRLSFVKSFFHPCRGFRIDCNRYGAVKFYFRPRRTERGAAFLVRTLIEQGELTFDPKQSPNPARMQVWGKTARQATRQGRRK
jgi:hypothetical protein